MKEAIKKALGELYLTYPKSKRVEKNTGLRRLEKTVTDPEQLELFKKALNNYMQYLKDHDTEPQFVKMWSTFCSQWDDWTDYESDQSVQERKDVFRLIK